MELIRKLLSSQKFLVLAASCIGLLITKVFKIEIDRATILEFVGLVASWLIAQGISDNGKGAEKVKAIANIQQGSLTSHDEKVEAIKNV